MITAEQAREICGYDPETGKLVWKLATGPRVHVGDEAGAKVTKRGYRYLKHNGRQYSCARLAWLIATGEWPPQEIDHINGVRSDNRLSNLRCATRSQNIGNQKRTKANTSGFKGVWRHQGKWRSVFRGGRKRLELGLFDTPEEAHAAYIVAAKNHHGEFARV